MRGGGKHCRLGLTAIQGCKAGQRTPIETRETQRLLGEQDHLIARRAALAAKPKHKRPTTGLIADIQMHHKKRASRAAQSRCAGAFDSQRLRSGLDSTG